jgi:hypothetical protein
LGWLSLPGRTSPPSGLSSRHPDALLDDSSSFEEDDVELLPLSLDTPPLSPMSDPSMDEGTAHPAIGVIRRIGRHVSSLLGPSQPTRRSRRRRGVMFFLPAFSTSTGGVELTGDDTPSQAPLTPPSLSQRSFYRSDKQHLLPNPDTSLNGPSEGSSTGRLAASTPPHYDDVVLGASFRPPAANVEASSTRRAHSANSRLS